MKCTTVIDPGREEEVVIYTKKRTDLTDRIEALINDSESEYLGYADKSVIRYEPHEVTCFSVEGGKVFAVTDGGKLEIKERLYTIAERLDGDFIKINQSCIANIKKIKMFTPSVSGSLIVVFKNGYRDCVSRRQMKAVKERLGFK